MNATQRLHDLGQSLWLDNITRDLLDSGTLKRYIDDLSVTGLTSNPTIFDHAIKSSAAYDTAIRKKPGAGTSDRKSTRLNSSHGYISYAVFCLKKKKNTRRTSTHYVQRNLLQAGHMSD